MNRLAVKWEKKKKEEEKSSKMEKKKKKAVKWDLDKVLAELGRLLTAEPGLEDLRKDIPLLKTVQSKYTAPGRIGTQTGSRLC